MALLQTGRIAVRGPGLPFPFGLSVCFPFPFPVPNGKTERKRQPQTATANRFIIVLALKVSQLLWTVPRRQCHEHRPWRQILVRRGSRNFVLQGIENSHCFGRESAHANWRSPRPKDRACRRPYWLRISSVRRGPLGIAGSLCPLSRAVIWSRSHRFARCRSPF